MDPLFIAKTKLLKIGKENGYVLAEEIAEVAIEFNLENDDVNELIKYLDSQEINMYDSLESAEEAGEDVYYDDEEDDEYDEDEDDEDEEYDPDERKRESIFF